MVVWVLGVVVVVVLVVKMMGESGVGGGGGVGLLSRFCIPQWKSVLWDQALG